MDGARISSEGAAHGFDVQGELRTRWAMHARPVIAPCQSLNLLRGRPAGPSEVVCREPGRRLCAAVRHAYLSLCAARCVARCAEPVPRCNMRTIHVRSAASLSRLSESHQHQSDVACVDDLPGLSQSSGFLARHEHHLDVFGRLRVGCARNDAAGSDKV